MHTMPDAANLAYVESLYEAYLESPDALPEPWREYFAGMTNGHAPALRPAFRPASIFNPTTASGPSTASALSGDARRLMLQQRVDQLVRNYRVRGHIIAQIDPLGRQRPTPAELEPEYYGFTEAEMDLPFSTDAINGQTVWTLREILKRLRTTYCRSIGAQFMHIDDLQVRRWLSDRMETSENHTKISRDEQLAILRRLTQAVIFEEFIQKKYVGAKSFSLEGSETLIPLLAMAIEKCGDDGLDEIILAMAHRGRLNVLANIVGKSPAQIFREFEDIDPKRHTGRGDVKYHLGYDGQWQTSAGRRVRLSLCFNPSHLEYVNAVAAGRVRAKQDRAGDFARALKTAIMIHGDASFIGQGVVQEVLNLSQLRGYATGGTLHVIVNNQVGFTTPPEEARSTVYASDVAKMLQSPIFHVNGEDPEAVAQAVRLSLDFRREFQRDVVIDLYCYRRRGHNEGDEPSFTQPLLYHAIEQRDNVREGYLHHLLKLGEVSREDADAMADELHADLERKLEAARAESFEHHRHSPDGIWRGYLGGREGQVHEVDTGAPREQIADVLRRVTEAPEGFNVNRKILRGLQARRKMAEGEQPVDWSAAEAAALGLLSLQGARIRLTGQDTARGTFSQRHAAWHDSETGSVYVPLANLAPDQAPVEILNSPLSESGVLGFEYGYSLETPDGLVLWEAQFGDFCNVAQPIIDQFICSAEDKWQHLSGLVLLLPHGFEGQGPEHSSARLERFLTLAAEDNIQIVNPTTPAQYFHVLRRQVIRKWRKPLIVMTPKSLLRHASVVSSLDELSDGMFQRVLGDPRLESPGDLRRVILCSGKVYYDLEEHRREHGRDDVAIIRLEQLYPFPKAALERQLASLPDGTDVRWVQEDPENMGAWRFLRVLLGERLMGRFPFSGISRKASASPATGSKSSHKLEQERLLERAFALP